MRESAWTANGNAPGTTALTPADVSEPAAAASLAFACPICHGLLARRADDAYACDRDGTTFSRRDGIWRFLPPERLAYFARFIEEYATVRAREGRGSADPAFYQALPFADRSGRFAADWRIRAKSFDALIARVIRPLEARRAAPLVILDLGSGNGWLANRLALRGHVVAAIDLLTNPADGLGAHRYYPGRFIPIQAEFDRLPLAAAQTDLVIFNASLHYAADAQQTLAEALRVLRPDGLLVILDTPVYRGAASGLAMVREREARFTQQYGFPSNAVPMEHFLTYARLDALGTALGLRWRFITPCYGLAWSFRPWRARLRGRREPAQFAVIVGARQSSLPCRPEPVIRGVWRSVLRVGLRVRRRRLNRLVLERVSGVELVILPGVFNPRLLRSGAVFAEELEREHVPAGGSVLDMGTGSGITAVIAARRAARVVAVDINPTAVRCARINALLNGVEDRIEVRYGDLFRAVPGERFDLITFNPPYYRGAPRDLPDHAWRSPDVAERFARDLGSHLAEGGAALVILSSDGDAGAFLSAFRAYDLAIEVVARHDHINEVFTVYRLTSGGQRRDDRPLQPTQ